MILQTGLVIALSVSVLGLNAPVPATAEKIVAGEKSYCIDSGDFCVRWNMTTTLFEMTMIGRVSGYVSFGISESNGRMNPGDVWAGWVSPSGKIVLSDRWNVDYSDSGCPSDNRQDLTFVSGSYDGGTTTVTFTRTLATSDTDRDTEIDCRDFDVFWAMSRGRLDGEDYTGQIPNHQNDRGALTMNFCSGATSPTRTHFLWFIPGIAFLVLTLVVAFVCQRMGRRPNGCADCCLHHKLGTPLKPNWFHAVTFNTFLAIPDLTWGEFTVVIAFVLMCGATIGLGFYESTSTSSAIGFAFGYLSIITLSLTLFPTTRYSILLPLVGISFERAIKFHRACARIAVIALAVHFGIFIIETPDDSVDFDPTPYGIGNAYGIIAFGIFVLISVLALETVRRKVYEFFFYTHFLFFAGLVFACLHSTNAIPFFAVPIVLLLVDRALWFYRGHFRKAHLLRATALPEEVVRLELQVPGLKFDAGQFVLLCIPQLSQFQFHPFSFSSPPGRRGAPFTVDVEALEEGTFCRKLYNAVIAGTRLTARVDGPYGNLSVPLKRYSAIYLVAGGIGVTPYMSVFLDIVENRTRYPLCEEVTLIWAAHEEGALKGWFPALPLADGPGVKVLLYHTGKEESSSSRPSEPSDRADKPEHDPHHFHNQIQRNSQGNAMLRVREFSSELSEQQEDYLPTGIGYSTGAYSTTAYSTTAGYSTTGYSCTYDRDFPSSSLSKVNARKEGWTIQSGRPDLEQLLSANKHHPWEVAVLACGPPELVRAAQIAAHRKGLHFHREVFLI